MRLGTQGFQNLAIALWFHLWPELRVRFVFRLSFGPHDIVDTPKPSLVCTPTALAARWTGHQIVGTARPTTILRAAAILSRAAEAQPALRFAGEIGARLERFRISRCSCRPTSSDRHQVRPSTSAWRSSGWWSGCLPIPPWARRARRGSSIASILKNLDTAEVKEVLLLRNVDAAACG